MDLQNNTTLTVEISWPQLTEILMSPSFAKKFNSKADNLSTVDCLL